MMKEYNIQKKGWFVALMLFILWPVGLCILLMNWNETPLYGKIAGIGWCALMVLLIISVFAVSIFGSSMAAP